MKILKILSALALLLGASLALADPPGQVGRLNYVSGTVSFAPAETNDEWGAATLNWPITAGDRVWADAGGRAEMHIGSTAIRIPELTSLDVLDLDERGVHLRLAQGSVHVRLRRLDAGENFEISTPGGAVVITQSGSYRVNVDTSGSTTTVAVRSGQADLFTSDGTFSVLANQSAVLSPSGPRIAAASPVDEFDNWAGVRDRREDTVTATQYVPPEMTGYEDLDQYGSWSNVPQYGAVWSPTTVAADWAPYSQGRWAWISPWGWTWIDDAPWGFAPSHYGRWVRLGNRWGWAPGARVARPMYAPALVAFVGGANWSISVSSGPAVGWVPLGWREPYTPWYSSSPTYVRNVNITHVTNMEVINRYRDVRNLNTIRYANRGIASATTVVTREAFVSGQRVDRTRVRLSPQALATAPITHEAPVTRPERASMIASRSGPRLPDAVAAREVLAARAPQRAALAERDGNAGRPSFAQREERARVRVVGPQQRVNTPAPPPVAPTRAVPEQPAVQAEQRRQQEIQQRAQQQQQAQGEERQRQLQQQKGQAEQQAQPQAQREERQRQLQQQQKDQAQAEERQRQVQQQKGQAEQQAQQQAQRDERQRQLQQQRAQQQKDQAQAEDRQRQVQQQKGQAEQQAQQQTQRDERQRQLQQQRAQQQKGQAEQQAQQQAQRDERQRQLQQQRAQQERAQQEQRQAAERAAEKGRSQPQRSPQEAPGKGADK